MTQSPKQSDAGGYGNPPVSTRFEKGRSGNPRGRPRGSRNRKAPYESVLGQLVTVRTDGTEQKLTAAEAFLLHMTRRGLGGDAAAARATHDAIEAAPGQVNREARVDIAQILIQFRGTSLKSRLEQTLRDLKMATKLDAYRETARVVLEPWLVEVALSRLGQRRLSLSEQQAVWRGTRTPWKVEWPEWWEFRGE